MKVINKRLKRMMLFFNDLLHNRESFYAERSDNWKNSDKGLVYLEKTNKLREIASNTEKGVELTKQYIDL